MNKKLVIVLILILGLVACSENAVNEPNLEQEILYPKAELSIMYNEEVIATTTLEEIVALESVDFEATLKSSGKDPIDYTYTGVLLKDVFEHFEVDLSNIAGVIVTAEDGYAVTVTIDKIMEDDNVYIAYKREGEWIENKDNGGQGPMHMIISNDPFSQYWCKFVFSINAIE